MVPRVSWLIVGGLFLVAIILTAVIYFVASYRPPRDFVFATGREGGAYHTFALEYQQHLADTGYTMNLLPTAGSVAILEALNDGTADVGFVQGGTGSSVDTTNLVSLGSVFYEPLWIFYTPDTFATTPELVRDLRGKRIAVGEEGSGSAMLARQLLLDNGITDEDSELLPISATDALPLLREGELDAVLFVSSPIAPHVREMLTEPAIKSLNIKRTLAYHRRYPHLTTVTLGEGSIDLAENIPSEDQVLLATAASLVAHSNISPDVTRLVLTEAEAVHGNGGLLEEQGEFPSTLLVEIPMAEDARRYLEEGPTGLERYLPYWLASRLEWFIFVILPLLVLAYPLFRSMPALYGNFILFQIYRWYQEVRKVEQQLPSYSIAEIDEKIEWLDDLHEFLTRRIRVPLFYLSDFYQLRSSLSMVIERLEKRRLFLLKGSSQALPTAPESSENSANTPSTDESSNAREASNVVEKTNEAETATDVVRPRPVAEEGTEGI